MNNIIICTYDQQLLPEKKTDGAVCRDIKIAADLNIAAGWFTTIGTGVKTYIPHGRCCKVYARSWLPSKMWLMLANGIAVFDADYRGEYIMQIYNFSPQDKQLEKHTRIAQMDFMPYYTGTSYDTISIPQLEFITDQETYDNFESHYPSDRGAGRFNSTGAK